MRVAGLQMDIAWEAPEDNFAQASELAAQAVAAGARLLALPEMFATGFSMNAEKVASHAPATLEFLRHLARRHGCWVLGGLAVPGSPRPRNACVIFDPDGEEQARYHKIHPFSLAREEQFFTAGDEMLTITIEGLRVTPVICYDLRFPELFRAAATVTELFVVIANWPTTRGHNWRNLLIARAVDCLAWVLGVNRVGQSSDGLHHSGDSRLVDPLGVVVTSLAEQRGVIVGDVEPERVHSPRQRLRFLEDRRLELYRRLLDGNRTP